MGQNWEIDPVIKDYVMEGGSPKQTDSLKIPAYIRLKTQRSRWLYAPNRDYGSDFHTIQKNLTTSDATLLENTAVRSVRQLVDDGRASGIDIETTQVVRHGVALKLSITDAQNQGSEILLVPIRG